MLQHPLQSVDVATQGVRVAKEEELCPVQDNIETGALVDRERVEKLVEGLVSYLVSPLCMLSLSLCVLVAVPPL